MTDVGTKIKLQLHKAIVFHNSGNAKRAYQHIWNARMLASRHSGRVGSGIPGEGARFLHDIDMDIMRKMSSARSRPSLEKYARERRSFHRALHYRAVMGGDKKVAEEVEEFFDEMRKKRSS